MGASRLDRALAAIYRALVGLCYPARHRDRVGDEMHECFEDLLAEARRRGGSPAAIGVALRTWIEIPRSAAAAQRASTRNTTGGGSMESVVQDIRYALRGLLRQPGFTLLAVLSLGLGVGANTSMFGMVNGSLWTNLPVPEAERLVRVNEVREFAMEVSHGNYFDVEEEAAVFSGTLLHRLETFGLVSDDISQVVNGELVTANYFEVLGIGPTLGRLFDPELHSASESPAVVVLSHYLWAGAFGADPSVIGSSIELNENPYTVIGVAPESFHGTKFGLSMDLWVTVGPWSVFDGWSENWRQNRGSRSMLMVARLADGVTLDGANAALETISARLAEEYPEINANMTLRATPEVAGQIAPDLAAVPNMIGLLAVFGSALVLLVACGNVASLLLARAVARRREMGVRIAIGAGRRRLVRQLLTESLLLAAMGATVGLALAEWAARLTPHLLPNIPYRFSIDTSPDAEVVIFAASASLLAVLVFGLVPALQASKAGIAGVLRGDDQEGGLRIGGSRLLNGVVVGVVALSFVTLFLAGLFTTSLSHVKGLDPGFAKEGRVLATLDFGLAGMTAAEAVTVHDDILGRVGALPGVTGAALTGPIPMGDFSSSSRVFADDRDYLPDEFGVMAWHSPASPTFLEVSGMQLLAGRWIEEADTDVSPDVVVINEAMATTFWPGENPVGKRIRFSRDPEAPSNEVVGVVANAKYMSMVELPKPAAYWPMEQGPRSVVIVVASTTGDPGALIAPVRDVIREIDPALTPYDMKTIGDHMQNAYWLYRLGAQLGLLIGLLAAFMAAAGLYGIMAFRVGRRRREMGIRIALGAGAPRVLRHVLSGTVRLVVLGVVIGGVIAIASSGVVQSIVFGVEAGSVLRLLAVGGALTALSLAATLAPAVAATRADPVQAIKTE